MTPSTDEVSTGDVRLVVASSVIGTTVEWYDFFLYGTAAGIVFNHLYFPSEDALVGTLLAFATFALGFLARPVGGLIFGHIGDRAGRKKTLVATMLIMGVATCLIGVIPTYASIGVLAPVLLVLLRVAQGIAIGGEWGGAVLMAVEYAPPGKRGLYGSFPQIGLALGLTLGTGVFALLDGTMADEAFLAWGWRIAFLLSAVLVIVGMFIRLRVMETPAFRALEEHEAKATVPALELARNPRSRRHTLLGMGSRLTEGIAFNAWAVFAISYGTGTLDMPRQPLLIAVLIAAIVMLVFIPLWGRLSDRLGRRRLFGVGAVVTTLLAVPAFLALDSRDPVLITLAIVAALGIAYPMMYGAAGRVLRRDVPDFRALHRNLVRLPVLRHRRVRADAADPDVAHRAREWRLRPGARLPRARDGDQRGVHVVGAAAGSGAGRGTHASGLSGRWLTGRARRRAAGRLDP